MRLILLFIALALVSQIAPAAAQEGKKPLTPKKDYIVRNAAFSVPRMVSRRRVKIEKVQQVYSDDEVTIVRVDYTFTGVITQDTVQIVGDYRCPQRVEGLATHRLYKTSYEIGDKVAFTGHLVFYHLKSRQQWQTISNQPVRTKAFEKLMDRHYRPSEGILLQGSEKEAIIKAACRFRPYRG